MVASTRLGWKGQFSTDRWLLVIGISGTQNGRKMPQGPPPG